MQRPALTILPNSRARANWRFILSHPAHFFAFGFGTGLSPAAPGTLGTLIAFPLFWVMQPLAAAWFFALLAVMFAAGVWLCGKTGCALGVSDHGGIVWDEIVAFLLVLYFTPFAWTWFILAFLLFRLFDIWKPFPIGYFDRTVKGGFGVMLDDLLAAGYALLVLGVISWWMQTK